MSTATAITDEIGMGEEPYLESTCVHCGWPVFLDAEMDWDTCEFIVTEGTYWQHNDDRYYTPGKPSPCPTVPWDGA